jgi:hypothetical protein
MPNENTSTYRKKYYDENKGQIIASSKAWYHKNIASMNRDELLEYRRQKSIYFKQWYRDNRYKRLKPSPPKAGDTTESTFCFAD